MLIVFPMFYQLPNESNKVAGEEHQLLRKAYQFLCPVISLWGAGLPRGKLLWNGAGLGRYGHLNYVSMSAAEDFMVRKKPSSMNRALCVLTLPSLSTPFPLCGAFLFSRLILFRVSWLFRHTIKFKFSELFTHACIVFLPVHACCELRSGNCTARI